MFTVIYVGDIQSVYNKLPWTHNAERILNTDTMYNTLSDGISMVGIIDLCYPMLNVTRLSLAGGIHNRRCV